MTLDGATRPAEAGLAVRVEHRQDHNMSTRGIFLTALLVTSVARGQSLVDPNLRLDTYVTGLDSPTGGRFPEWLRRCADHPEK